jgi:hypothetical protein
VPVTNGLQTCSDGISTFQVPIGQSCFTSVVPAPVSAIGVPVNTSVVSPGTPICGDPTQPLACASGLGGVPANTNTSFDPFGGALPNPIPSSNSNFDPFGGLPSPSSNPSFDPFGGGSPFGGGGGFDPLGGGGSPFGGGGFDPFGGGFP